MNIRAYNRKAWNMQVDQGNRWTIPVSPDEVAAARAGNWSLLLTPTIPVPRSWYPPDLNGTRILGLASGGGQQGPILAAAGARVTILDNSPRQLEQDRLVALRENLPINLVEGDMRDLTIFPDHHFDLIFHPVSNIFIPDIRPVWQEAFRVLRPGGALLAGFNNPVLYIFDWEVMDHEQRFEVRYQLPYSDLTHLPEERLRAHQTAGYPLEFGHLLDDQIGGQLEAGFFLTGFYEDRDPETLLSDYIPLYIATRALKPPTS